MAKQSLLPPRRPLAFVGSLLGSYQSDLGSWLGRLSTKYALALGFVIAGAICILAALAVALAALFRWVELNYGEVEAYAAVFGLLFGVGIIALLAGLIIIKRRTPAFPKGEKQINALTTTVSATADRTARIVSARVTSRPDNVTKMLAGSAAAILAGWMIAARRRSSRMNDRWLGSAHAFPEKCCWQRRRLSRWPRPIVISWRDHSSWYFLPRPSSLRRGCLMLRSSMSNARGSSPNHPTSSHPVSRHPNPIADATPRSPWQIPLRGWRDILVRTYHQIDEDRVLATAAGVVFYGLLAIFPAITALVSSYGLFADPATISSNLQSLAVMLLKAPSASCRIRSAA